jgi:hypothetical protein
MVSISAAEFRCYRIYDVADETRLDVCRDLMRQAGATSKQLTLTREGSEFIQLSNPPLRMDIGKRAIPFSSGAVDVEIVARVFQQGAISLCVRIPVAAGSTLESLIPIADAVYDSQIIDAFCLQEVNALREQFNSAMEKPHLWNQHESYTVLFLQRFNEPVTSETLLLEPVLARLIIGEGNEPKLSSDETHEILEHRWSYTPNDLVIVEWNAALVYEPSGSEDIVDLLEIANAQLLELRYYDHVLDAELAALHATIRDSPPHPLLQNPYKALRRDLMLTIIELSEFIERIENALKIIGDVYLARVYEGANVQLRIPNWTEQVTRKHRLLQQTYALLKGEVDTGRALILELLVVLLIVFEIIMALAKIGHD